MIYPGRVPSRKQRRRRQKDFRHDVRVYEVDEEGNEVAIAELRAREEKPKPEARRAGKTNQTGRRPPRGVREVQPPSWERALRRGGLMGGAMLLVFLFLLKSGPIAERLAIGIFYGVAFVPLTYLIDRTAYRSYLKRLERGSSPKPKSAGKTAAKKG
jgi:hypothetical protein